MFSRILLARTIVGRLNVGNAPKVRSVNFTKSGIVGGRQTTRTNTTTTTASSPLFTISNSYAKLSGFWGTIERYHAQRLVRKSTKLAAPLYQELDVKAGPDIKILVENVKADLSDNDIAFVILGFGSTVSLMYFMTDVPDFSSKLMTYSYFNWPVWLLMYYNSKRARQCQRLLNSIKE